MIAVAIPDDVPDAKTVVWAQETFYGSQVISDAEVAWRILKEADENGRRISPPQALNEAHSVLKTLVPPTSTLMERSGWVGDRHRALVRYAYSRAASRWDIRKVWVDLELPIVPSERKRPPTSPSLTFTPWGRLPRPDIFLEGTEESKVWIECQTVVGSRNLTDQAKAARQFGDQNVYTTFVIVGVNPDNRYLDEVRKAVEESDKKFEHWDPINEPLLEIGTDAIKLIHQEVQPPPPTLGPLAGSERFWAWRGGSNRDPAVITHDVCLKVPSSSGGGWAVVSGPWPRNCRDCNGSGSSPGSDRVACPRCAGNGLVPEARNDWKLCSRCWAAQAVPLDPCAHCQGRGWTTEESTVLETIGVPLLDEPFELRERVVNLYPDMLRSRKLILRVHITFEDVATKTEGASPRSGEEAS